MRPWLRYSLWALGGLAAAVGLWFGYRAFFGGRGAEEGAEEGAEREGGGSTIVPLFTPSIGIGSSPSIGIGSSPAGVSSFPSVPAAGAGVNVLDLLKFEQEETRLAEIRADVLRPQAEARADVLTQRAEAREDVLAQRAAEAAKVEREREAQAEAARARDREAAQRAENARAQAEAAKRKRAQAIGSAEFAAYKKKHPTTSLSLAGFVQRAYARL